jgi:hypothetical protein
LRLKLYKQLEYFSVGFHRWWSGMLAWLPAPLALHPEQPRAPTVGHPHAQPSLSSLKSVEPGNAKQPFLCSAPGLTWCQSTEDVSEPQLPP